MQKTLKRYWYRWPGMVYAYRTTESFANEREAREMIRRSWEFSRLPNGTEVWT